MAIKLKPKKTKPDRIDLAFIDEKIIGGEPPWDTARALLMSDKVFDHHVNKSLRYYNYFYTSKAMHLQVYEWLVANKKLTKPQLALYLKSDDWRTGITAGSLIKAEKAGMPLKPNHIQYVMRKVIGAIDSVTPSVTGVPVPVQLSIQDHLLNQLATYIAHFELLEDRVIAGTPTAPDAYTYLTSNSVPQSSVGKLAKPFRRRLDEITEAKLGKDEQLKESYSHYTAKKFKDMIAFYSVLLADLESYGQTKKVARKARVKKPPSKEKLVASLVYKKDDAQLKITSINPVDILSATALWVYNTRTNKLGVYYADSTAGTLGLRGNTVLGFDENRSVCKTLRKPEAQLLEFAKSGKVAQRKFLDEIKTTGAVMRARISKDSVLLKVLS